MLAIQHFIVENNFGDWASIFGVLLTLLGFALTLQNVVKSKNAAEAANIAVQKIRNDFKLVDTSANMGSAIASMEEIKRMHRSKSIELLPDRYAYLRKFLIEIKCTSTNFSSDDQKVLQSAISQISSMEQDIEEKIKSKDSDIDIKKLNRIISKLIDGIQEIQVKIKSNLGEK